MSIQDNYIEKYLAEKKLHLPTNTDIVNAFADFVIITALSNYDLQKNFFFDCCATEGFIYCYNSYQMRNSGQLRACEKKVQPR